MPEFVGTQAQPVDALQKISDLLSIQRSRTALGVEQQRARQAAALAKYDWNKHVGVDGTIDVPSLNDPELMAAAGDQYQQVIQSAVQTKQSQLQAIRELTTLRGEQRAAFGTMIHALRSDPDVFQDNEAGRQKLNQGLVQFSELYGKDVLPVVSSFSRVLQNAPKGQLNDALRSVGLQAQTAEAQLQAQQPSFLDSGSQLQNVNPNAIPTAPITRTISPSIQVDAAGNPNIVTAGGVSPVGQAGPRAAPGDSPFVRHSPYVGSAEDAARFSQDVEQVRSAADQAPVNRTRMESIIELSRNTNTGPLVSLIQSFAPAGQIAGDDYQTLAKYLEQQAIGAMTSMGGAPSDARLSSAVAANGSTKFNPAALREVTYFNLAANDGLEAYRNGLDAFLGPNPDYTKIPQFRSEWAKNFDIDVFRLEAAIRADDQEAVDKVLEGKSRAQIEAMQKKMDNLESLSETGKLP